MIDREKKIDPIAEKWPETCEGRSHSMCYEKYCNRHKEECTSCYIYHLLSNGVTFAKDIRVLTNADKIRAMSDEQLAEFLANPCECSVDPIEDGYRECGNDLCKKHLLEWLKQPAKEGE